MTRFRLKKLREQNEENANGELLTGIKRKKKKVNLSL
jgi:hypothetical protein